jgi:hypothetical protein
VPDTLFGTRRLLSCFTIVPGCRTPVSLHCADQNRGICYGRILVSCSGPHTARRRTLRPSRRRVREVDRRLTQCNVRWSTDSRRSRRCAGRGEATAFQRRPVPRWLFVFGFWTLIVLAYSTRGS